jgi:hypothetical protein
MEPNKLETQIKEQLNAREIQPSEMAWDRLDAMLSVAEEKKTKRFSFLSFQSIGIAASVLVLVSLGLFFFNQKETVVKPENNVVVNEEVKQNNSKQHTNSINGNTGIDNNDLEGFDEQVKQRANQQKEENKTIIAQSSKSFNQNNQKTAINPLINQEKEIQFQNQEVIAQKELPQVDTRNTIVISKPTSVTIDDLLASTSKKSESKPKVKINANSLLSQVDGELDQTFREKVLTRVSKNYQEVKVALATRNQE